MAKVERALVWSALEELSESYREVLTLYYREGKSIAEVSAALETNVDAARQRLNRGRIMLKGHVAQLVEGVLVNSAPDKSFRVKVVAGLVSAGAVTNSGAATASGVAAAQTSGVSGVATATVSKIVAGTSMGMMGGLAGTVGGLGDAFLGIWLPAQFAPTETERQLVMRRGRVMMGFCLA
ncbi:MAG: sigma-70 family RNA polymerase sigma factor [Rubripirellula sp.]|nr:sigma-70 family RNA polymerase sigma factor [Rubripirellula sp.]